MAPSTSASGAAADNDSSGERVIVVQIHLKLATYQLVENQKRSLESF
jgi:hypothetical protein